MGQNVLRLFDQYTLNYKVTMSTEYISGKLNEIADTISRVNELFVPKKSHIYNVTFQLFIKKVCTKYSAMKYWRIFLRSPDLLSDLNFVLSSTLSMEEPKSRKKLGRFVTAKSISFGTANNGTSSTEYFL